MQQFPRADYSIARKHDLEGITLTFNPLELLADHIQLLFSSSDVLNSTPRQARLVSTECLATISSSSITYPSVIFCAMHCAQGLGVLSIAKAVLHILHTFLQSSDASVQLRVVCARSVALAPETSFSRRHFVQGGLMGLSRSARNEHSNINVQHS